MIDLIARIVLRQIRPLVIRNSNIPKCGTPIYDEAPVLTKPMKFSYMYCDASCFRSTTPAMAMPLPLVVALINQTFVKE